MRSRFVEPANRLSRRNALLVLTVKPCGRHRRCATRPHASCRERRAADIETLTRAFCAALDRQVEADPRVVKFRGGACRRHAGRARLQIDLGDIDDGLCHGDPLQSRSRRPRPEPIRPHLPRPLKSAQDRRHHVRESSRDRSRSGEALHAVPSRSPRHDVNTRFGALNLRPFDTSLG